MNRKVIQRLHTVAKAIGISGRIGAIKKSQYITGILKCIAMLYYFFLNAVAPSTIAINQNAMKMKNITLAIDAAPAAIPVKPKIAATIAMIKNVAVHLSIKKFLR